MAVSDNQLKEQEQASLVVNQESNHLDKSNPEL
jgi:hypothetical protein